MLFSYTLLLAMLTTFVAAVPFRSISPRSTESEYASSIYSSESEPIPAPNLPGKIRLLDAVAADYLTYDNFRGDAGWTRLPSPDGSVSRFLFFEKRLR
jgi:hypothetical protein